MCALVESRRPAPATAAPKAAGALPRIWLAKDLRKAIAKSRHPWLFDGSFRGKADVSPGDVVAVAYRKDTLALGLYDPASPLRVRLLSWNLASYPDAAWAGEVAAEAAARRREDPRLAGCTGVRLLHGESDWAPGLVLDAYAGFGVAAFDGDACEAFWRPRLPAVVAAFVAAGLALRGVLRKGGDELLWGEEPPPGAVVIQEHGARYEVDVRRGQKTGFFLDQRENRLRVRQLSAGKEVLDLFSYTGGFAVAAALGGAVRVTAVDQAAPAMAACQRNFALNGLQADGVSLDVLEEEGAGRAPERLPHAPPGGAASSSPSPSSAPSPRPRHRLCVADCWDFLRSAAARGEAFDIVVNDPPSMAPSARTREKALRAYMDLNRCALAVVKPGGLLLACSCSSHVTGPDLRTAVEEAGQLAGRRLRIEAEERAASDHPVRKGFPEGDYLQVLYVRVLP